ncbi:MFS transporter [Planctomycetales bacterium]|nr:MFS transporter [Planctomycetales bacterium]
MSNQVSFNHGFLWRICLIAALGGLLFGYDFVVIGGAKPFYEAYFRINTIPALQGWVMSCALLGCLFGVMLSGSLADIFGRKKLLLLAAVLFVVSGIGVAVANSLTVFVIFRIVGGMGIGLASGLSPMFIAEVSPKEYRGRFVSFNQLTIVIGILASQIVNYFIARTVPLDFGPAEIAASWNGLMGWRWMFGAGTFPAVAFLVLMFFVPESPKWLVSKGQTKRAKDILTRIGGYTYAETELAGMEADIKRTESERNAALQTSNRFSELLSPKMLPILALGVFLAVFQQWCGINVIFNYAEEVFKSAGYHINGLMFNIVITGIINLVFTFVAIVTVDRWGRRPLMLFGAGGLAAIYGILGYGYYIQMTGPLMLVLVLCACACFAMTLGPMVWVILSEIYPTRIRGAAMSVAVASLWIACAVLSYTFPILNSELGASGTFWVYGGICLVSAFVIYFSLPETKGKTLEEIEAVLFGGK